MAYYLQWLQSLNYLIKLNAKVASITSMILVPSIASMSYMPLQFFSLTYSSQFPTNLVHLTIKLKLELQSRILKFTNF